MGHPTDKKINDSLKVSVSTQGYPYWTYLEVDGVRLALEHEEARDLLYAMKRIVAFLDSKEGT